MLLGTREFTYSRATEALNYRDSRHFGHQRAHYTPYGKRGTLSAQPFQPRSGLFSDNFLIPVTGGKITTETQPKVCSKNLKS